MLSRRKFLLSTCASGSLAFAAKDSSPPRPNIVLIIADDLASWMVGCYGNKEIKTPNIDKLAEGGCRFVNNFVCTPICSASRATLFTGRVPRQHGVHDFLTPSPVANPPQGQKEVPASFAQEAMLSDVLAGAGYDCGYVGKWHMGGDEKPKNHFSFTYTMLGGSAAYQNPKMSLNGEVRDEKGYLADLITQQALGYLDKQKADKPFFLTVSYFNPHTPYTGHPQKYYDMYASAKFETVGYETPAPNALREKELLKDTVGNLRKCAASTTALDDQIPLLQKKLREKGLTGNTLVIFTGDNGFLLGRHGLWSKGLASDPINMYEEVMQTPMIWNWPGQIPVQSIRPELVSFYDFVPSACAAAGVEPPARNLVGRSYLPLALGKKLDKKSPWPSTVFGYFRNTEMARDGRFKLVLRNGGEGPNELFDLSKDGREKVNVYGSPSYVSVQDRLRRELDAWRKKGV